MKVLFEAGDVLGDVDEGADVNGELSQDGADKIDIEDIRLRSFL